MHRIHQLVEHLQIFILQIHKVAVFQSVIFLAEFVAFQHFQQLFPADALRVDLQVKQTARHRHAHRHAHPAHDVHPLERVRAAYLPEFGKLLHTAVEHVVDAILLSAAVKHLPLLIDVREYLPGEEKDLPLAPLQTKTLIICAERVGQRKPYDRALLFPIPGSHAAGDIPVRIVEIEDERHLRRQIPVDLLAVLLHDVKDLLELRQHGIIEIRELGAPDPKVDLPFPRHVDQRADLVYDIDTDPVQAAEPNVICAGCSHQEVRHPAADADAVKFFLSTDVPALSYLQRGFWHAVLADEMRPVAFSRDLVLILDSILPHDFIELVKAPAKQPEIRAFPLPFPVVIPHLTDAVDHVFLLLYDLVQKLVPLSCAGAKVIDVLFQYRFRPVLHGLRITHLRAELDQILDDIQLSAANLEGKPQSLLRSKESRH